MGASPLVIGVSGETGTGKTHLAIRLTQRFGASYCSIGEIYLALVGHAELIQGWSLQSPLSPAVVYRAIDALEEMTLETTEKRFAGETYQALSLAGPGGPMSTEKSDRRVRRVGDIVARESARSAILMFLRREFRTASTSSIVLDGREAYKIADRAIFLCAPFAARVGAVMRRTGQSRPDAVSFVLDADERDRAMNESARRHRGSTELSVSLTESPAQRIARVVEVLRLDPNRLKE